MTFENNYASESGGGIYVEFPPIRFVIDIFNRLCFLQYNDETGIDKPPQDWLVGSIVVAMRINSLLLTNIPKKIIVVLTVSID